MRVYDTLKKHPQQEKEPPCGDRLTSKASKQVQEVKSKTRRGKKQFSASSLFMIIVKNMPFAPTPLSLPHLSALFLCDAP